MTDIDAILASGQYVDRRGRVWLGAGINGGVRYWCTFTVPRRVATEDQLRLRIVREKHRATCPGLRRCHDHPVPHVLTWGRFGSDVYGAGENFGAYRVSLAEALDAARRMTGEQK